MTECPFTPVAGNSNDAKIEKMKTQGHQIIQILNLFESLIKFKRNCKVYLPFKLTIIQIK